MRPLLPYDDTFVSAIDADKGDHADDIFEPDASYDAFCEEFAVPESGFELFPQDLQTRRQIFLEKQASFVQNPLPDRKKPGKKMESAQKKAWEAWARYITEDTQSDPDQVIIDLCLDSKQAHSFCQSFLDTWILRSVKPCLTLGKQEVVLKRTVNSANTVLDFWNNLVGAAERGVLQQKRWDEPDNPAWTLMCKNSDELAGKPAFKIRRIEGELANRHGLELRQNFEKKEATINDILTVLDTLWTRAGDIPCDPSTRLAFHTAVILDSLGGWRPGMLMGFRYRDVQFSVVRDPRDHERTALIATITLHQTKRQQNKVKTSQDDVISFSIGAVPYERICLMRALAARALFDDAFEYTYDSFERLLNQPDLENVDYVKLEWKEEMLDQPIVPIQYGTFWGLWQRVIYVMGCRGHIRPYSMRVGAGARLDGPLTPAVRNYILSNSDRVYQKSYQPRHVREDLAYVAYGDLAGQNEALHKLLRSCTFTRDDRAPLYPTKEDLSMFERRNDVRQRRLQHSQAVKTHGAASAVAKKLKLVTLIDIKSLNYRKKSLKA